MGAIRIANAIAIPYPVGNPELVPNKEDKLREEVVDKALELLTQHVEMED